jgi:DNA-binding response OmpR family regulator
MRLLLAEDERELSRALVTILTKQNYSVDAVFDGEEALAYLAATSYDGVILDIMMPKMDGLSVLRQLRKQGNDVPVLLLTAKTEIDDRVVGLDCGADDYLTKPFAPKELLARIRAMTRRGGGTADPILKFGNVHLNRATFELSSESGSFRLANKEFQMMEMLMMHPGSLIPSDRFLEKIWGLDSEVENNIVWVYISYLRKKLKVLAADAEIRVARNIGYTLEAKR